MTEPARDVLQAKFTPGFGLEVFDPEDFGGPVLWNYEVADFSDVDRFLQDSDFPRITEWVLDDDNEYIADVEFICDEAATVYDGREAAPLIDLAAVNDVAPAAMELSSQQAPETEEYSGRRDHGADLE
jgi:hypothetical protein